MSRHKPGVAGSSPPGVEHCDGLSLGELEAERGIVLPDREAFATVPSDPTTALLDVFIDLDAALDLAAPINAALAANANVALPIDAAVSANALSPGSISLADANQTSIIEQVLQGDATASSNQDSAIMQGEGGGTAATEAGGQTGEFESAPIADAPAQPVEQVTPVADTGAAAEPVEQVAPVAGSVAAPEPVEQLAPVAGSAAAPEPVEQLAPVPADASAADPASDAVAADTAAPAEAVTSVEPGIAPSAANEAPVDDGNTTDYGAGTVTDITRSAAPAMSK